MRLPDNSSWNKISRAIAKDVMLGERKCLSIL